ncbi:hypothetical protein Q2298_15815 [Rhodococcus electrodiphilus]|uniref:hypothetical protein n=1 Tax=Rhodococcus ruber TaxID=1830 RepID=UPI0026F46E65|nr:hypothetical protein [Rhodococcus ruber]MDO2379821.1 hypothetical protein [Rhodococcus ruber]
MDRSSDSLSEKVSQRQSAEIEANRHPAPKSIHGVSGSADTLPADANPRPMVAAATTVNRRITKTPFPKDSVWLRGGERAVAIAGRSRSDGLDDVVDDARRGERREPALLVEPHVLPVRFRLRFGDGGEWDVGGARRGKRAGRRCGDDSALAGATIEEIAVEGGPEKAGNVVDAAGSGVRRGRYGKGKRGAAEHGRNKSLHKDLDSME